MRMLLTNAEQVKGLEEDMMRPGRRFVVAVTFQGQLSSRPVVEAQESSQGQPGVYNFSVITGQYAA